MIQISRLPAILFRYGKYYWVNLNDGFNMKYIFNMVTCCLLMSVCQASPSQTLTLPLQLDYGLIKKVIADQLYTGKNGTAKIWHDKHDCSHLTLSNPQVAGDSGQIRLTNDVVAQIGTQFGGQCIPLVQWSGMFETLQRPTLSQDHAIVSLPVTKATAYDKQGKKLDIAKLQDLIKTVAEPKLAGLKIDLNKSRSDLKRTLGHYVQKGSVNELNAMLDSLQFNKIEAGDAGIHIELGLTPPANPLPMPSTTPLTANEQQQWQSVWQDWHGFLSKTIDQARQDTKSDELHNHLTGILRDLDQAFNAGITRQTDRNNDPIRLFFTRTWDRLSPILRELSKQLPETKALQYLTFITATDVMYQLDAIGAPFGLGISSDGLRNLARLLIAEKQQAGNAT